MADAKSNEAFEYVSAAEREQIAKSRGLRGGDTSQEASDRVGLALSSGGILEFDGSGLSAPHNKSKVVENTRSIYDLDRPGLKGSRYDAMQLVETDWNTLIGKKTSIAQAYTELHCEIMRGEREYSAAQLWALDRLRKRTIQELTGLPGIP